MWSNENVYLRTTNHEANHDFAQDNTAHDSNRLKSDLLGVMQIITADRMLMDLILTKLLGRYAAKKVTFDR